MPGRHIGAARVGRYDCGQHLSARPETDRRRGVVLVRMGRAHRPGSNVTVAAQKIMQVLRAFGS